MVSKAPSVALVVEQLWQRTPGGSGTYVRELTAALLDEGADITGLAAWHRSAPADSWRPDPRLAVSHAPLPRRALYELWSRARAGPAGRADLVHATTWALPPRRRRLVVTVHDLAFVRSPEHFTPHGVAYFTRALELVRNEADLVIAVSAATARDLVDAGIEPARTRVVPNGVRIPPTDPSAAASVRSRIGSGRPYLLWCGTLEPRKNLPTLLRAYRAVAAQSELDLVLVGPDGWGDAATRVASLAEALPAGRVHRLGALPSAELHAAYAGAAVFAFPSLWEGFGLPVLEAMAHGVPVVTSRESAMAEVAGDAAVLVDPSDEQELAAAVLAAAHDEDLAQRGVRRAAQYTWARAARDTAAAYREAAG